MRETVCLRPLALHLLSQSPPPLSHSYSILTHNKTVIQSAKFISNPLLDIQQSLTLLIQLAYAGRIKRLA